MNVFVGPDTHSLFDDEENQQYPRKFHSHRRNFILSRNLPVIACKPSSVPSYLSALNPCDQIFDWEELEYYYQVANRKPTDDDESDDAQDLMPEEIEISPPKKRKNKKASETKKEPTPPLPVIKEAPVMKEPEPKPIIDNPFLKSITKKSHN